MDPDMPLALLDVTKTKARHRSEGRYWDYKERLPFDTKFAVAEFAKDVLAFHNTEGGVIIVGISNDYVVRGVARSNVLDSKETLDKIRKYVGDHFDLFQDSIDVTKNRGLWLIFVPKYSDSPRPTAESGPVGRKAKPVFVKGDYFYREGDEVKRCQNEADIERIFLGFSTEHLNAYNYQIDERYYRLLNPGCDKFVGRKEKIGEIKDALLRSRHPVIALDGLGGVGKTELAIQVVRELYDDKTYMFISSVSAKSKVWAGGIKGKKPQFAGLHELLSEIAQIFPEVSVSENLDSLRKALISVMKDTPGLILIDNLEEIDDPSVLKFISREIPDPVKVLITSRTDKNIGSLTIPVIEMTAEEAHSLLATELERLGYFCGEKDSEYFEAILSVAAGVPLAIKWAAQIATERRSLRAASSILRSASSGKEELLSFCFATMYDSLSPTAKDAARLIPYLSSEWKPTTLSVALDLSLEIVKSVIHEISDSGIIYTDNDRGGYTVLPLTREFLFGKWNENSASRRKVNERFDEAFASDPREGFLLDWPEQRRAEHLLERTRDKMKAGDHEAALKLARLAQTWHADPRLRFLEGRILFEMNKRDAGLVHMRKAMEDDTAKATLKGEEVLFFADAVFSYGGRSTEKEALDAVSAGIQKGGLPSESLVARVVECSIQRRDYRFLGSLLPKLNDDRVVLKALDHMRGLLDDGTFLFSYSKEVVTALDRVGNSALLDEEQRLYYRNVIAAIRQRLRQGAPDSSHGSVRHRRKVRAE
jgi:hypothetical protein